MRAGKGDWRRVAICSISPSWPWAIRLRCNPALDVADGTDEARGCEGFSDTAARLHARGEGLFDEGVHPGLGQRQGRGLVVGGGRGDDRGVDAGLDEFLDAAQDGQVAGDAEAVTARVGQRNEVHSGGGAGVAHVVSAHRADAEDSEANTHVRPPLPRARSRRARFAPARRA